MAKKKLPSLVPISEVCDKAYWDKKTTETKKKEVKVNSFYCFLPWWGGYFVVGFFSLFVCFGLSFLRVLVSFRVS